MPTTFSSLPSSLAILLSRLSSRNKINVTLASDVSVEEERNIAGLHTFLLSSKETKERALGLY
jgi:hypothetical protein